MHNHNLFSTPHILHFNLTLKIHLYLLNICLNFSFCVPFPSRLQRMFLSIRSKLLLPPTLNSIFQIKNDLVAINYVIFQPFSYYHLKWIKYIKVLQFEPNRRSNLPLRIKALFASPSASSISCWTMNTLVFIFRRLKSLLSMHFSILKFADLQSKPQTRQSTTK